jgi:hypothetical protein
MMPVFSPTDAAFEGFRLTREQPRVVAAWAALYAVMGLVAAMVMISTIGPEFETLRVAAQGGGSSDPAETMRLFRKLAPFYAMILPIVLVFWSVLTCAVYRAVLRPEQRGIGRLRFGADEARMMGLTVLLWLLMFATVFLATLFVTLGGMMTATVGGPIAGLLGAVIGAAGLGVAIWIWARLSLAGPMTFMTGQIHIFRSWALTKGHAMLLVWTYGLAAVLAVVVSLLALVIFTAIAGVLVTLTGGSLADITRIFQPNVTSIAAYFTPAQILYQAFSAVLQVVVYAVLLSPAAVIYAALTGRPVNP